MPSADEDRNRISTAGWTLEGVLAFASNFRPIERISASSSSDNITSAIEKFEENGVPVIIDGWHHHEKWPKEMFTLDFFQKHSATDINVRNVHDRKDSQISLDKFIGIARHAPPCAPPGEKVRMYGKDAECPQEWSAWIKDAKVIPEALHWNGSNDYFRYRPKNAQVETLMCYLGVGDTFTPAHKDLCASSGHNLMCWTENGGSSFWFMTESADAAATSALFQNLGAELDHEMHVVTLKELAGAPFTIYVAEQKLGDMVLVPPRSCHQVVNYGGITLKTSWSRMTLNGLLMAYYHELPIYQRVCRLETYRVKSTIFVALRKQTKELEDMHPFRSGDTSKPKFKGKPNSRVLATMESLKTLLTIFREIMAQEWSAKDWDCIEPFVGESNDEKTMETRIVCDFCGADIFQSFLECNNPKKKCAGAPDPDSTADVYTVCPGCYVEGRSCKCMVMTPRQCLPHAELLRVSEQASQALEDFNAGWTPPPLNANYSTFKAACALAKNRIRRLCIYDKDKEETDAIYCKPCHHSKCYAHLLRMNKIHAVEGIEKVSKDPLSFHLAHQQSKETYTKSMDKILDSQKTGTSGPIDMLRVHYALVYPRCFPRSFEYSSLGFYDAHVLDYDEVDADTPLNRSPLPSLGAHNTDSDELAEVTASLSELPSSMENTAPSPKGPRTKRLIPYVQVPSAPYLIRERLRVSSDVVSKGRGKGKARATEKRHIPRRDSSKAGTFCGKSSDDERPRWTAKPRRQKDTEDGNFKQGELSISTRLSNGNGPKRQIGGDSGPLAPLVSSSAPPLRHRFKSGMFVTLQSSPGIIPSKPAVESTPAPPSPSETHATSRGQSQPPEPRRKRKREQIDGGDHGLSLAEAMNRASAVNSEGISETRKRSRIDVNSRSSSIQHLSSHPFPNRNEWGKEHRANKGSRIKSERKPQVNREDEVKGTKVIAANEATLREAMTAHALALALKPEVRSHLVANGYRLSNPNSNPFQAISPSQSSQRAGLKMAATVLRHDDGAGPSSRSFDGQSPASGGYADEQIPSRRAQDLEMPMEHKLSSPSNPCSPHQSPGAIAGPERSIGTHDNPPPLQPPQPPAKGPRLTRRSLHTSQLPKTQRGSSNHRPGGRFKKARLRQTRSSRPSSVTVPMLRRNHSNSPQRRPKATLSQKLQHERMLLQRRKSLRLEPGSPGKQHRRSQTEAPKSSL